MDIIEYGETYNRAMQGIEDMLFGEDNPMDAFKRDLYPEAFQAYLRKYLDVINAIERIYQEEEDKEAWLDKLATRLVDAASQALQAIPKKSKRNDQLINYNMILAVYVFPALLEQKGESAEALTDLLVEKWNKAFKTSVGKASYEKIESGFHRKWCYITTAVCESRGRPDDCYELELFRSYRDEYLLSTAEGTALVDEYYDIAPTIVNRIGRLPNSREIYDGIWDNYLSGCVRLIEKGENEACRDLYKDMVYDLKERYMA